MGERYELCKAERELTFNFRDLMKNSKKYIYIFLKSAIFWAPRSWFLILFFNTELGFLGEAGWRGTWAGNIWNEPRTFCSARK